MDHPSSRGWQEIRVSIALSALAALAVVLRFVARMQRRLKFELDDWLALGGLVCIVAMLIEEILWATIGGSGKHIRTLSFDQVEVFFKIFLANEFTYAITSPIVKISVIVFYRRIFSTQKFKIAADVLIAMCILWGVATFLAAALQCRPLKAYWDISVEGHCFNAEQYILGVQGVNIFLDVTILCLPMKMVWGLRRPWQERLALTGVFLLGGFVVFASIYRIITIKQIDDNDITYTTFKGSIWTFVEPCIGLVCSCLPTIRSLFPAYRAKTTIKASASNPVRNAGETPLGYYSGRSEYLIMNDYRSESRGTDRQSADDKTMVNKIKVRTTIDVV